MSHPENHPPPAAQGAHTHEIVLVGMVNVNRDNYLQGTVDVWRCRQCKRLFCDDKRYGEPLKPSVGFEEIGEDEEWGILTCTDIKEVYMVSLPVKPGKQIVHTCRSTGIQHEFLVGEDWTTLLPTKLATSQRPDRQGTVGGAADTAKPLESKGKAEGEAEKAGGEEEEEGETIHRIFLVKDNLNKAIEAGFYRLRMMNQ